MTVQYEYVQIYDVEKDEEVPVAGGRGFETWLRLHESDYL